MPSFLSISLFHPYFFLHTVSSLNILPDLHTVSSLNTQGDPFSTYPSTVLLINHIRLGIWLRVCPIHWYIYPLVHKVIGMVCLVSMNTTPQYLSTIIIPYFTFYLSSSITMLILYNKIITCSLKLFAYYFMMQ